MHSISVITLAYNEEGSLERVVQNTLGVLARIAVEYEVIVVNDGSTDQTGEIAEHLAAENQHVRVVHHEGNRGIGAGMNSGHQLARYDLISYAVGDGQIPPASIVSFLEVIDDTDVALGMFHDRADSWKRKLMSFVWRDLLTRLMFGSLPMADGNYMFRRVLIEDIDLISTTGVSTIELMYRLKQKGCRFTSVAVDCLPRLSGESKVANWRWILRTCSEMVRLRLALAKKAESN